MMLTSISLFKPSRSHCWYIQFTDTDGRRRQKSTGKCIKRDALKVLIEFEKFLKAQVRPMLLSKLIEQFLEYAGTQLSFEDVRNL